MGREIKRVEAGFDWPVDKKWSGYLNPHYALRKDCPSCAGTGLSPIAKLFKDEWYGNSPFNPVSTGSEPFTPDMPQVHAFAQRNVESSPSYYGGGAQAVHREAMRLCEHWNGSWSHHLAQFDVDALIQGNRLWDFTRIWVPGEGWKDRAPMPTVTARDVNLWSIGGMGHDSINCWICVKARAARNGQPHECSVCDGDGDWWPNEAAKRLAEEWEQTEPPAGDWWMVWETVSEGSPVTPAFPTAEALIDYLVERGDAWDQSRGDGGWSREAAEKFVGRGSAMSLVVTGGVAYSPRDGQPP